MKSERTSPDQQALVITVPEAARRLGIGRSAAYAAAVTGELPTIRIGRSVRVPLDAFKKLLEQAGQGAKG